MNANPSAPPILETRALCKSFPSGTQVLHVLRGIDLALSPGEFVSIVGVSGAGKSTLLHILGGLDRPTSGSVVCRGNDLFSGSEEALADYRNTRVGFVFQFHHLLPEFTAIENVLMPGWIRGERPEDQERARILLAELGLADRGHHRPGQLSGGEQQRVALARALFLAPEIVLADEPTGNLDSATGQEIHDLILEINRTRKTTFVIVTHNETLARRAHRCLRLEEGKLVEVGLGVRG